MTIQEYINKASKIHNNFYDYSKVSFSKREDRITIICPKHGEFSLIARNHLDGAICPQCKKEELHKKSVQDLRNRFFKQCEKLYNGFYDYSKSIIENREDNIIVICPEHGEFTINVRSHMNGTICPKCRKLIKNKKPKLSNDEFINKCKNKWGDKFSYENTNFIDYNTPIKVNCKIHGEFEVLPKHFLYDSKFGCKQCSVDYYRKSLNDFINEANITHNYKYDYSKFEYINNKISSTIICPIHGEFKMSANSHLRGQGCPKCGIISTSEKLRDNKEIFIEKSKKIHKDKFDYSLVKYVNNHTKVTLKCNICGAIFEVTPCNNITKKSGCPKCSNIISRWETEIKDFIINNDVEIEHNNRKILDGKEIDILIPSFNIGIECDGIIYHSELYNKDKNYHINKTKLAKEKNIKLIHIFEDEWKYKKDIVKSRLKNLLHKNDYKIYARKCDIKKVDISTVKQFLESNHIQGYVPSKINLGLYFNNELISLMTFGNLRKNLGSKGKEGSYELLRFCNKLNTSVIGGASKLFKYFLKNYNPNEVISYCDLRWSDGNLYEVLSFELSHISKPNYFYIIDDKRENRFKYRKDALIKEGFDSNKTEREIMLERGIYRVYDCGCNVYKYNVNKS